MPDITNEDLMKLIYRLIKKQDTVDSKLDKVLEILHKSEVIDTTNEVFLFKPIKNLEELEAVTQRLESDPVFRRQLKAFLIKISRGNIKLEHIFSDEFLFDYNWPGVNGKKKLEGIALFDHYYVALKQKEGNSDTEIRKICNRELKQIKDRIFARNLRKKQQEKSTTGESSADVTESKPEEEVTETVDEFVEIQDYLEFETVNDGEYYIEISQSDHEALNQDHNYHDMEDSENNEENIEENNEIEQISEEFSDDELLFPIKNDKELEFVTKKLQNDEKYKKQARALMRLHDDLKIDHIFTQEFLYEYNLTGVNGKKKLENLLPYTEIYEYLKLKSGLSRTDARRSAMKDFDRIKHRLNKKKLKTNTELHSKRKVEDSEDENTHDTFQFPIKNDEELELVSKMLSSDESFKNQVYVALNCHEDLKLEHVFSSEFLFDYNLLGINGKKQLENLIPFKEIYVYLKEKEGLNNNEIRKLASKELETNKNRIYQRSCRKKQKIVQNQDSIEIEETEDSIFSPIKNEEELENVSKKLKSDQQYLKNVRLQIVQSSEDGQCTLEQIFSSNFLTNYILNGLQNKQKLSDTIPYRTLYFYLKKHMGQNIKEIELDTQIELKQLKQDLIRRKFK